MPNRKKVEYDVSSDAVVQLGGDLYKNVYGILVEYITNSYDADATRVEISIDREKNTITIKDNGIGMSLEKLEEAFTKVGINRRRQEAPSTAKGRLVTGKKGLGKLACFGLFSKFEIMTVQDGQKSTFVAEFHEDENGLNFDGYIDDKSVAVSEPNNTMIILSGLIDEKNLPPDHALAESIAKRINLMYHNSDDDEFFITVNEITIDKEYRNDLVLRNDTRFVREIPKDLGDFNLEEETRQYFHDKGIRGHIIARQKTVRIQENKGVVLFARGKLCQEATYLNINPSNNYAYAHLYGELYVDFIDDDAKKDHIGTDRTALKDTELTRELLKNVEKLMQAYANLYDEDSKKGKNLVVDTIRKGEAYQMAARIIERYKDISIKEEATRLLDASLDKSVARDEDTIIDIEGLIKSLFSLSPQIVISSSERGDRDTKDNITVAYDRLVQRLREKYRYNEKDGAVLFQKLYGEKRHKVRVKIALPDPDTSEKSLLAMMRGYGEAASSIRNVIYHANDRECIDETIAQENMNRFIGMVDLIIELDELCFDPVNN